MSSELYKENPYQYLTSPNVVIMGLADKKAGKSFMGQASDTRRLFVVNKETRDICYYKLVGGLEHISMTTGICCEDIVLDQIKAPGNEKNIQFKGHIQGNSINKIELDNSGKQANKGAEINIHTDDRIYTLYFLNIGTPEKQASMMKDNINKSGAFTVVEQTGGSKHKTKKRGRKHKKQTHKKHSRKNKTRKRRRRQAKKLAKKSRKSRR